MTSGLLQQLYKHSSGQIRSTFKDESEKATRHYRRYVEFSLAHLTHSPARILDVGCGSAWSTRSLRLAGHEAYGIDLHTRIETSQLDPQLPYVCGDARQLPFPDRWFDGVALHEVLEHVSEPERVLNECLRVLKPSGRLIVVGPHLLSLGVSARSVFRATRKAIWEGMWLRREPETPLHPFGNTMPETYRHLVHHARHTLRKLWGERPVQFMMREPDSRPPFHSDNDACYWCNPMDLLSWGEQTTQLKPIRWWANQRRLARFLWPVAGGTWVVLEKASVRNIPGLSL